MIHRIHNNQKNHKYHPYINLTYGPFLKNVKEINELDPLIWIDWSESCLLIIQWNYIYYNWFDSIWKIKWINEIEEHIHDSWFLLDEYCQHGFLLDLALGDWLIHQLDFHIVNESVDSVFRRSMDSKFTTFVFYHFRVD